MSNYTRYTRNPFHERAVRAAVEITMFENFYYNENNGSVLNEEVIEVSDYPEKTKVAGMWADIYIKTNKREIFVEIINTNPISKLKREAYIANNVTCYTLNVRKLCDRYNDDNTLTEKVKSLIRREGFSRFC